MKFARIQAQKAVFPIEMICHHLAVSRSGHYACCHRHPSDHQRQDQVRGDQIQGIHQQSRGTYGRAACAGHAPLPKHQDHSAGWSK